MAAIVALAAALVFVFLSGRNSPSPTSPTQAIYPPAVTAPEQITTETSPALIAYPPPPEKPTLTPSRTLTKKKETPRPTATPELLENGWYLYRDPDGEFSFEYPPEARLHAGQNPYDQSKHVRFQFIIPETTYQGISIKLRENLEHLSAEEIVKQIYEHASGKPAPEELIKSIEEIKVGKLTGYQVKIPSTNSDITIIVPYKDKYFTIYTEKEPAAISVDAKTLEYLYQILETFKYPENE